MARCCTRPPVLHTESETVRTRQTQKNCKNYTVISDRLAYGVSDTVRLAYKYGLKCKHRPVDTCARTRFCKCNTSLHSSVTDSPTRFQTLHDSPSLPWPKVRTEGYRQLHTKKQFIVKYFQVKDLLMWFQTLYDSPLLGVS